MRRPQLTLAVPNRNVPTTQRRDTTDRPLPIEDTESAEQLAALGRNAAEFGIQLIETLAAEQGIVTIGPEQRLGEAVEDLAVEQFIP